MKPQAFTSTSAVEAGRKGGQATAVLTKQQALGRIALQWPGSRPEALSAAYERGYKAGNAAKTRAGDPGASRQG